MSAGRGDVVGICFMRERRINTKNLKIQRNVFGMMAENIFWCLNFLVKKPGKPFNQGSIVDFFFWRRHDILKAFNYVWIFFR